MEHLNSSRMMACIILLLKFSAGILIETTLIFHLSALSEDVQDIQKVLVTFVIYVVVYEAPTLFFKLKMGQNQAMYARLVHAYNEIKV